MIYLHFIGLLTFEILVMIAAMFMHAYAKRHALDRWIVRFGKAMVIVMHVVILATLIHGIVFHFMHHGCQEGGCATQGSHHEMMMQHHGGGH